MVPLCTCLTSHNHRLKDPLMIRGDKKPTTFQVKSTPETVCCVIKYMPSLFGARGCGQDKISEFPIKSHD